MDSIIKEFILYSHNAICETLISKINIKIVNKNLVSKFHDLPVLLFVL